MPSARSQVRSADGSAVASATVISASRSAASPDLGRLLPFEAGPQGYGNPYAYQQQQQQDAGGQLAPQGFLGGLAGSVLGGLGGGAIGKAFGNRNLGRNIGRGVGGALGAILPFDASPQYGQQAQAYQNYGGQQGWYPAGYQGQQG